MFSCLSLREVHYFLVYEDCIKSRVMELICVYLYNSVHFMRFLSVYFEVVKSECLNPFPSALLVRWKWVALMPELEVHCMNRPFATSCTVLMRKKYP